MAKHPAAFINAIADEGTKAEAVKYLQETWDELQDTKSRLGRIRQEVERRRHTDDSSILDEITTLLSSALVEKCPHVPCPLPRGHAGECPISDSWCYRCRKTVGVGHDCDAVVERLDPFDAAIERDAKAGKLDWLADEAREALKRGEVEDL